MYPPGINLGLVEDDMNYRRYVSLMIVLFVLSLIACGGGRKGLVPNERSPGLDSAPHGGDGQRILSLDLTVEEAAEAGERVTLTAKSAGELYQMSFRLGFNPEAVRPLAVERGELVDDRAVFFTTMSPDEFVPVAFTYHPGEEIPSDEGVLVVFEFEVVDSDKPPEYSLVKDPEFLIANDRNGRALEIELEVGA